jgi:hypothetical protein
VTCLMDVVSVTAHMTSTESQVDDRGHESVPVICVDVCPASHPRLHLPAHCTAISTYLPTYLPSNHSRQQHDPVCPLIGPHHYNYSIL